MDDATRTTDQPATQVSRPRHRAADSADLNHWWRRDGGHDRHQFAGRNDDGSTAYPEVHFPGTGAVRAVVDPWQAIEDVDPARLAAEHGPHHQFDNIDELDASSAALKTISNPRSISQPGRHRAPADESDSGDPDSDTRLGETPGGPPHHRPPTRTALAVATTFPLDIHPAEQGTAAYARQTKILSGRQMLVWLRDRPTLFQSLMFPALSMIMFKVVLGDAVSTFTGQNSAYGTVPLVILVAAMFGSLAAGVQLMQERSAGLLTRLYVMPIHRGADLSARLIAEMARILLAAVVLTIAGFAIGFRFDQGFLAGVGIYGVALLFGISFSTLVLALALTSSNIPLVPLMTLVCSLLMFFNSGFIPTIAYPAWLQPIVENQPMSCAIEVMRSLAVGGPIAENLIKTIAWSILLVAVFAYPAIRGYRRAASSPNG
ncbi:ABC transporter permease [Nocardia sp. 348MFTsu5.1]|uniref:ABC transporter permease n=1 Tax=Nocardia sp. 348MFTsu5.1 TaxID=1172185 RepID=UPI000372BD85